MRIAPLLLLCVACQAATAPEAAWDGDEVADLELQLAAAGSGAEAANARQRGPRWRGAQLLEHYDGGDSTEPRVASDPSGRAVAVWTQAAGTVTSIWASRFAGSGWGAAAEIDDADPRGANTPHVSVSDNGNAVAQWQRATQTKGYSANQFRGGSWGTPQTFFDSISPSAFFGPVLSGSRTGTALVGWASTAGRGSNLFGATLSGTTWTLAQQLPLGPATALPTMGNVRTASSPNGDSTLLWSQNDGTAFRLFINQFRNGAWGTAAIEVDPGASGGVSAAGLAIVRGPAELVAWRGTSALWANKRTSAWQGARKIRDLPAGATVSDLQVVSDSRGNGAFAIWLENNRVWTSRWSADTWSAAVSIEAVTTGNAGAPTIALEPGGNAVAVWTHAATRTDVWANRFVPGRGWGTATLIENDDTGDAAAPSAAVDGRGRALAVWQQSDGTRLNVLSNRFD